MSIAINTLDGLHPTKGTPSKPSNPFDFMGIASRPLSSLRVVDLNAIVVRLAIEISIWKFKFAPSLGRQNSKICLKKFFSFSII